MTPLELVLVYLLAAVVGVVVFRTLRLPPMLAYLTAGVLIGPHMLGMVQRTESVQHLAEMGVVLLMFVIGLEFSLSKLRAMRQHVFGLGLLQVVVTMLVVSVMLMGLRWLLPAVWDLSWHGMLALAGVLAMSSTAIVVKLMAERLELDSEHGRRVLGVLLLQDLAVVPLLILVQALAAHNSDILGDMALALGKGVALIAALLLLGPRLMERWMYIVARRKSDELFMLNVLFVTLGLAWLTEQAGLSMALGAFIAGMLISETPYKHHVESDIRPFHDLLLGLFFITIGMMLDWREVVAHWGWVLLLVTLPLLLKAGLIWLLAWALGASQAVAIRTGLYLAQAGEFGFVLLNIAQQGNLLPAPLFNTILASMVISMALTPFIIQHAQAIVHKLARNAWLDESMHITELARQSMDYQQHVIICGWGRSGQLLARMLGDAGTSWLALEQDPDLVRQASLAGAHVVYGDAARQSTLLAAGLLRAQAVVISFIDTRRALHIIGHVRQSSPTIPIIVRTADDRQLDTLRAAGATEVIPEALEGSLMLAGHVLALTGVPVRRVLRAIQQQRSQRYALLRGFFRGADDDEGGNQCDELERLHTLPLQDIPQWAGHPASSLLPILQTHQVTITTIHRSGQAQPQDWLHTPLHIGDVLVLHGKTAQLAQACQAISSQAPESTPPAPASPPAVP